MNVSRSTTDYNKILNNLSGKGIFRWIGLPSEAIPINTIETIEYHKNCLTAFLQQLYGSTKGVNGILIIPVDTLKKQFLNRYDAAQDKKAILWDELKFFYTHIAKINGGDYRVSKFLYQKVNLGQQEQLYKIPYNSTSYLKFQHYAFLWDLIHYKIFLDRLLTQDYKATYQQLNFDLKPSQLNYLFEQLKGKYIDNGTKLSDFINVFNLYSGNDSIKVKWIHLAQNKQQVNKIGLIHLIKKLQNTFINNPKLYMGELYNFISERFADYWNKPFAVDNLSRCNSDNYAMDKPNVPRVRAIKNEIETIISAMMKI